MSGCDGQIDENDWVQQMWEIMTIETLRLAGRMLQLQENGAAIKKRNSIVKKLCLDGR